MTSSDELDQHVHHNPAYDDHHYHDDDQIHGRFTEEQRKGIFKPEVAVAPNVSAQDKLLAYTGRDPSV